MGRPSELHISIKAWLIFAALAGVVWGLNALIEGSSMLALLIGPIIMWTCPSFVEGCGLGSGYLV